MGTALLILLEVVGWGPILIGLAALIESGVGAPVRRRRRRSTLVEDEGLLDT